MNIESIALLMLLQIESAREPVNTHLESELLPEVTSTPPSKSQAVPFEVSKKTLMGLSISGGILASAGFGVLGGGIGVINSAKVCNDPTLFSCRWNFAKGLAIRNAGISVLGAGVGLIAGALVWQGKSPRQRMILWSTFTGVGVIGIIAGEFWIIRGTLPFNRGNTDPSGTLEGWDRHWQTNHHLVNPAFGATLRGLGTGLLASSIVGLIVQYKYSRVQDRKKISINSAATSEYAGISFSGIF